MKKERRSIQKRVSTQEKEEETAAVILSFLQLSGFGLIFMYLHVCLALYMLDVCRWPVERGNKVNLSPALGSLVHIYIYIRTSLSLSMRTVV